MIRLKKLSLDEVLPYIDRKAPRLNIDGNTVRASSVRLLTLKRGTKCVECGITGTHFWAEKHHKNDKSYHLNLYATAPNGDEVLMTKDHIVPKSKGGSNQLNNMQTMCCKCNQKKDNGDIVKLYPPTQHCDTWVWAVKTEKGKRKGREKTREEALLAGMDALAKIT